MEIGFKFGHQAHFKIQTNFNLKQLLFLAIFGQNLQIWIVFWVIFEKLRA